MKTLQNRLINTKTVFSISLLIVAITVLSIWLLGLGQHRTIFENSLLSLSILSVIFFIFITVGLYKSYKLKDDMGKLTDKVSFDKLPKMPASSDSAVEITAGVADLGAEEGITGIIISIILWFLFSVAIVFILWLFGAIFWFVIIAFIAMLYWIFFRALRLVFKKSHKCKGDLAKSMTWGLGYSLLYIAWIYGIVLLLHYI